MAAPLFEPMLALTAATPIYNTAREGAAADGSFRDLLAPRRSDSSKAELSPPANEGPQAAASEASQVDDKSEDDESNEETSATDDAAAAAAVTANQPIADASAALEAAIEAEEEAPQPSSLHATKTNTMNLDSSQAEANGRELHSTDGADDTSSDQPDASFAAAEAASRTTDDSSVTIEQVPTLTIETAIESTDDTEPRGEGPSNKSMGDVKSKDDNVSAQHDAANDEASKTITQPETPAAASDAASPSSGERPKGKSRDTDKQASKSSSDAIKKASSIDDVATPSTGAADNFVPVTEASSAASAPSEVKPPAAVDGAALRPESGGASGVATANASTERLGAMLAQRRMRTGASDHGQPLTESQQARLVQRVARAFDTARMRGETEIRLRLSPPELGSLKLEVRLESGVMTARLEVETVAAQQALADNLGTLKQRLAEQNIRVEQFDIDLMDRHGENPSDSPKNQFPGDQREAAQRGHERGRAARQSLGSTAAPTERATSAATKTNLDVLI